MRLIGKQLASKLLWVLSQVLLLPALLMTSIQAFGASDAAVDEAQRWGLNMTEGVTAVSREIYDLHMLIFWICVWIGIVVFGIMFYSMIMHRKSSGAVPSKFCGYLRQACIVHFVA